MYTNILIDDIEGDEEFFDVVAAFNNFRYTTRGRGVRLSEKMDVVNRRNIYLEIKNILLRSRYLFYVINYRLCESFAMSTTALANR